MSFTPEQIAAFVGAAAWAPQIANWGYKLYRKPRVVIIPEAKVEIGYTIFGPRFNIRLALSTDTRDVLLDSFSVKISHETGETKIFKWAGTKEILNQTRDSSGIRETVEKDEAGIAIKVRPETLVDKIFRFQDPDFIAASTVLMDMVDDHYVYLKTLETNIKETLLTSNQFHNLLQSYSPAFSWRSGNYTAEFDYRDIQGTTIKAPAKFRFVLTTQNIQLLQENFAILKPTFEWNIFGKTEEISAEPQFKWVHPNVFR